ncbi:MAG: AAA family ATPase, partial [Actinomycetales bacterium]
MPQTARAIRIGLIGGECTGKSTLAADLSAALRRCLRDGAGVEPRVVVVGEVLRTFVTEHQRAPQVAEQAGIMAEQRLAEEQAEQIGDIVIADPA